MKELVEVKRWGQCEWKTMVERDGEQKKQAILLCAGRLTNALGHSSERRAGPRGARAALSALLCGGRAALVLAQLEGGAADGARPALS